MIFDESQKEGNNEIWIDIYPLTRFLAKHTQAAVKVEGTKEWVRTNRILDSAVEEYAEARPMERKQPGQEQPEMTGTLLWEESHEENLQENILEVSEEHNME